MRRFELIGPDWKNSFFYGQFEIHHKGDGQRLASFDPDTYLTARSTLSDSHGDLFDSLDDTLDAIDLFWGETNSAKH